MLLKPKALALRRSASLLQAKGAKEPQFLLCRDVRFEQQCRAQTLQNLGGEETRS